MNRKSNTPSAESSGSVGQSVSSPIRSSRYSGFTELGFKQTIEVLCEEIRELYLEDQVPWIIGYSGGKDSTATLQLIWMALKELPSDRKTKIVHVISTDTLVENPIVSSWVRRSIEVMAKAALEQGVPIKPKLLHPRVEETFWVNLIGRGYPAPRHKFRWCTERLKIRPSNRFITDVVTKNGEAILVLGARKEESQARAKVMKKNEKYRVRSRLSPSATLAGCLIYTPVEDWTSDDVWMFLTQVKNPWGHNNKELLNMYAGASADGECPLVVDTSTPSCGDSRFGCWVCTLVEKDKSMTAMIQNDAEKEWMLPLLELRNALDFRSNATVEDPMNSDHNLRDFRRMTGAINIMQSGKPVPGPYTQESRELWLTKLLKAQTHIRKRGPEDVRKIELITLEELQEVRRIWVVDKHELEDSLPGIYQQATGDPYPGATLDDDLVLGATEMAQLAAICEGDRLHYELSRELLSLTRQQRNAARRAGLFEKLEKTFSKHFYDDKEDAVNRARGIADDRQRRRVANSGFVDGLEPSSSQDIAFNQI
ncbi:MAG: DNA phosphorothioation system sulfurtransferase DndC [Luteolibacter sp.]